MTCQVRVGIISVCWIGLLGLSGCGMRSELNTEYGQRDAGWGRASVNGTGLLAKMYEDSGRPVSSWRRLSRRLE